MTNEILRYKKSGFFYQVGSEAGFSRIWIRVLPDLDLVFTGSGSVFFRARTWILWISIRNLTLFPRSPYSSLSEKLEIHSLQIASVVQPSPVFSRLRLQALKVNVLCPLQPVQYDETFILFGVIHNVMDGIYWTISNNSYIHISFKIPDQDFNQ